MLSDEQRLRLSEYRSAFTFESNDERVAQNRYSDGQSGNRKLKRGNRSRKQSKQWRTSQPERSVLRYSTGG